MLRAQEPDTPNDDAVSSLADAIRAWATLSDPVAVLTKLIGAPSKYDLLLPDCLRPHFAEICAELGDQLPFFHTKALPDQALPQTPLPFDDSHRKSSKIRFGSHWAREQAAPLHLNPVHPTSTPSPVPAACPRRQK